MYHKEVIVGRYSDSLDEVYDFIYNYIQTNDEVSPSIREIAEGCHLHVSTASRYVHLLALAGRIRIAPGKARSIRLAKGENSTSVPN
jgi:SOS-response transcriptional repressor LexA